MQFALELNAVPALLGVSIYVSCQILLWLLTPHRGQGKKTAQPGPGKSCEALDGLSTHGDLATASCPEGEVEPEPIPEPEDPPEGREEGEQRSRERTATVIRRQRVFWCATPLLLLVARLFLAGWNGTRLTSAGAHSDQQVPEIHPNLHRASLPANLFPSDGVHPESLAEQPDDVTDTGFNTNNEAALNIKLTRQAMNDDNYIRSAYYGTLTVGTPSLEMTVIFDTGSGHLVLPSMFCKSETCKAHTRYRRSASSTARDIDTQGNTWNSGPRDSVTVSFGTGEVTGVFVEDVVCMGNVANISEQSLASRPDCTVLHFVAATELSEDPFKSFHFDGILGLGLSGLSQSPRFNFMNVMAESIQQRGGHTPHTFGVFLAENENEESEIALGGWASAHLQEDLSWGPIYDPQLGHWVVPIHGIRVDNDPLDFCDDGSCRAAVDTGTSLLSVPSAAFREMYEALRHPAPLSGHCRGYGPLLHVELEHFTVSLGPHEYGQVKKTPLSLQHRPRLYEGKAKRGHGVGQGPEGRRVDLRCLPMLMTLDLEEPLGPKLFILGEPVLRKYYTVYDGSKKQVGFGRARHRQAPTREELLEMAPQLGARPRQRMPTMFDIFRWRQAMR